MENGIWNMHKVLNAVREPGFALMAESGLESLHRDLPNCHTTYHYDRKVESHADSIVMFCITCGVVKYTSHQERKFHMFPPGFSARLTAFFYKGGLSLITHP